MRSAYDVVNRELGCGLVACGDNLGGSAVFITFNGDELQRSWVLLRRTEMLTGEFFGALGLASMMCPIPEYHKAYRPD